MKAFSSVKYYARLNALSWWPRLLQRQLVPWETYEVQRQSDGQRATGKDIIVCCVTGGCARKDSTGCVAGLQVSSAPHYPSSSFQLMPPFGKTGSWLKTTPRMVTLFLLLRLLRKGARAAELHLGWDMKSAQGRCRAWKGTHKRWFVFIWQVLGSSCLEH